MNRFYIQIGPRKAPRLCFEAMSEDSVSCVMQHADLALPGERMEVCDFDMRNLSRAVDLRSEMERK